MLLFYLKDAVFFGSAGGPEWGFSQPNPESGLLRIRQRMQVGRVEYFLWHITSFCCSNKIIYLDIRKPETLQLRREVSYISLAN